MTILALAAIAVVAALAVRQYVRERQREADFHRHVRQMYGGE